jgi:alpha-tubulin suppressor-like RCC1 family protein
VSYHYHDDPVEETAVRSILPKFIAASVLMLFSFFYYQTTLASNINLNSSSSREFGQGVTITAPCAGSDNLVVTPTSTFVNAANGTGAHYLTSVGVAGIPASCNGDDFSLSFYDSVTGSSALPIFSFFGENKRVATVYNSAGYFLKGFQSSGTEVSSASGAFTVTFKTPEAFATNAMKVTLQTTDHKDWAEASISSSVYHTCTLLGSSRVKCWGWNADGQMGDGSQVDRNAPVDVSGLGSGFIDIAAGYEHSCAVLDTGTVKCWGGNTEGQIGDGTNTRRLTPVNVSNLSGVSAIQAQLHTCALLRAGGVKCWGRNNEGQIGDGGGPDRLTPVDVSGLSSGVTAIAAGHLHTCALLNTGEVKCWGKGSDGQIGDGGTSQRSSPTDVSGLSARAIAVAAGKFHTCALLSTGKVQCWGLNTNGQLGNNTTATSASPVDVTGITNAVAISAGGNNSCALLGTGAMQCWGHNTFGQVGDGSTTQRNAPVGVSGVTGLTGVRAITTGFEHSCAVLSTGAAKCWGNNTSGRLGTGNNNPYYLPESVSGIP